MKMNEKLLLDYLEKSSKHFFLRRYSRYYLNGPNKKYYKVIPVFIGKNIYYLEIEFTESEKDGLLHVNALYTFVKEIDDIYKESGLSDFKVSVFPEIFKHKAIKCPSLYKHKFEQIKRFIKNNQNKSLSEIRREVISIIEKV